VSRDDQTTENRRLALEKVGTVAGRSFRPTTTGGSAARKAGISVRHSTRCSKTWYGDGSMFKVAALEAALCCE
jgi:hypothetical protein